MVAEGRKAIRVDIFDAFSGAFRAVFGRFGLFWRTAWPPALVFSGLITALYLQLFRNLGQQMTGNTPPRPEDLLLPVLGPLVLVIIVSTLVLLAFVARWMQVLLDPAPPAWFDGRTTRGFARFMGWYLLMTFGFLALISLLLLLIGLLVALIPQLQSPAGLFLTLPFGMAIYIGGGLCAARLALLFPAAMAGRTLSVGQAWQLMHGNTWRLAVTILVLAIVSEIGMIAIMLVLEIVVLVLGFGAAAVLVGTHADFTSPALANAGLVVGSALLGLFVTGVEFVLAGLFAAVPAFFYRKIVLEREAGIPSVF